MKLVNCPRCRGQGLLKEYDPQKECYYCLGGGSITRKRWAGFMWHRWLVWPIKTLLTSLGTVFK